ncbi:MAG: ribose-5-phosphate isomerase RpiA [Methanomicrobiaceae archaeon]|uniref:ribose-5-phosphate isomerase n=1 Tax=hydrocarbon metagenome TaxID=938273 RepID=A0A0W8FJY8_9ZZZZ|nr:ribose-5-phosphate isomerase RpiA [Methanomicrobiaceae archaeon]
MDNARLNEEKRIAGYHAAGMVEEGGIVGLGTGSTVLFAMERLGARIAEGLSVAGIPTSYQAALRAREYGIPLASLDEHPKIDIAIDGADQVDPRFNLIKGRGAAHLREKIVADAADQLVIVVDRTKMADRLDAPVPIEVLPFACSPVLRRLTGMGGRPVLREAVKKDGPVITDNGNLVIDCSFGAIGDAAALEAAISAIPGVVGCGLFTAFGKKMKVVIGDGRECRVLSL